MCRRAVTMKYCYKKETIDQTPMSLLFVLHLQKHMIECSFITTYTSLAFFPSMYDSDVTVIYFFFCFLLNC